MLCVAIATAQREILVQNLAPFQRSEWASCVVPFAPGESADAAHVDGRATTWHPFGARWPDGSWRQAECRFRTTLGPLAEERVALVPGAGPPLAEGGFGLLDHTIRVIARPRGRDAVAVELAPSAVLVDDAAHKVVLLRARIADTGLVAEATIEVCRGQEHAWFGIGLFFSDPTTTARTLWIDELALDTDGLVLVLRHAGPLGVVSGPTADGSHHVLLRDTHLGDGQGLRRAGVLVPPLIGGVDGPARLRDDTLRAAMTCRLLAATDWSASGAFGAFGYVPPPPPWLGAPARLRSAMAKQHAGFVRWLKTAAPEPFRSPRYGLAASAHQAGDQPDFGVVALEQVAGTGIPSFLFEVEWSVLQEGCRPVHYFEADGRPLRAADHPQWVALNGRTHYHLATSPDRLGKTDPDADYDAHRWFGKDSQHWSSNYLCAYYLLTADPQCLLEIRNEVQLFLASQTLRDGIWTSKSGNSRAAGRTMLAGTWLWLCTGDPALLERLRRRMHDVNVPQWEERRGRPADRVRPFVVYGADPRYFEVGDEPVWVPWEEALCVTGFAAYQELTDDRSPAIVELVDGLASNLLRHAWRVRDDGTAQIAYAMKLRPGGEPIPDAARDDRQHVNWPKSSFSVWAIGSLELGRAAALRAGDEALVARAEDLLRRVRAGRAPTRDGFYDRLSMWDAVRVGD